MDTRRHVRIGLSCAADILADGFLALVEEELLQINEELARHFGIHFDLDHWQKTVSLGKGKPRVQDRLNERIFAKADIYLGIFWTRHGTPPGKAVSGKIYGSGCEEEFYRAKAQLDDGDIWIFFSDCPIPPSKLDSQQLTKARRFKLKVQEEKVEYTEFSSKEEFKKKFRSNISNWIKSNGHAATDAPPELASGRSRPVAKKLNKKDFKKFNKGF